MASPTEESQTTQAESQTPPNGPPMGTSVQALFSEYGQAMHRVGQLEHELLLLRGELEAGKASSPPRDQELEKLDRIVAERDSTISSLGSRLSIMETQLRRTEEKLMQAAEGSYIRQRRRHRRRWWRLWLR